MLLPSSCLIGISAYIIQEDSIRMLAARQEQLTSKRPELPVRGWIELAGTEWRDDKRVSGYSCDGLRAQFWDPLFFPCLDRVAGRAFFHASPLALKFRPISASWIAQKELQMARDAKKGVFLQGKKNWLKRQRTEISGRKWWMESEELQSFDRWNVPEKWQSGIKAPNSHGKFPKLHFVERQTFEGCQYLRKNYA